MCGLAGIAGPGINVWDIDILNELAYVSGLRGRDSTGIIQGHSNFRYKNEVNCEFIVEKDAMDVGSFQRFHKFDPEGNKELFKGIQNNFFAVHTRQATKGEVNKENSHPFEFTRYVGMHNGTLMETRYHQPGKTDSELFIKQMDEEGVVSVLKKLSPVSAYAIVLFDKKTGELVFARNDLRPLYLCFSAARSVMYWASEKWMLEGVMKRNKEGILNDEISFFKPQIIYRIDPSKIKFGTNKQFDIEEFVSKPLLETRFSLPVVQHKDYKDRREAIQKKNQKKENVVDINAVLARNKERVNLKSNILNVNENTKKSKNLIPAHYCCACNEKMTLVDQYFGTKLSFNTFLHKKCQEELPVH